MIISLALILRPAGDAGAAIFTSAMFALIFFYDVLFEVLGGGRTPGKRWTGLRVVRSGGRPITLARSSVRNILRIIDILPGFYAVGMTVIFIAPRNQRIGDLAAGSHVVRIRHGDRPRANEARRRRPRSRRHLGRDRRVAGRRRRRARVPRAPLRPPGASTASRSPRELASRLRPRVGGAPPNLADEAFLELLVAAKAARA